MVSNYKFGSFSQFAQLVWAVMVISCAKWTMCFGIDPQFGSLEFCRQLDPVVVTPEGAKYSISVLLGLYKNDCNTINLDGIQQLLAVQWALSHWNENPHNADKKIALYASNTCSRPDMAKYQLVQEVARGYHDGRNCTSANSLIPLGIILPPTTQVFDEVGTGVGAPSHPPLVAFTETIKQGVFTTAPRLSQYVQLTVKLLQSMNINLVDVLTESISVADKEDVMKNFNGNKIFINSWTQPSAAWGSGTSPVKIVFLNDALTTQLNNPKFPSHNTKSSGNSIKNYLINLNKLGSHNNQLVIFVPTDGRLMTAADVEQFAQLNESNMSVLVLQQAVSEFPSFRKYFLDVVRTNYGSHPLLSAYMEEAYKCEPISRFVLEDNSVRICEDLSFIELQEEFVATPTIENIVLATYALASGITKYGLQKSAGSYEFGEYDPRELQGYRMSFDDSKTMTKLLVSAFQVTKPSGSSDINLIKVAEASADSETIWVEPDRIRWSHNAPVRSRCTSANPICKQCESTRQPQLQLHHTGDLYLVGLFNWHKRGTGTHSHGPSQCGPLKAPSDLLPPLAFVYALQSAKSRYGDMNLLEGVEVGSLLLDACDSAPAVLHEVAISETSCLDLPSATGDTNKSIIIHPDSIAGFSGDLRSESGDGFSIFNLMFTEQGVSSVLGLPSQADWISPQGNNIFSTMPLFSVQASVIYAVLDHYGWNHVSVLVSNLDKDSVDAYQAFLNRIKRTKICIANTIVVQDGGQYEDITTPNDSAPSPSVVLAFTKAKDLVAHLRTRITDRKSRFSVTETKHNKPTSAQDDPKSKMFILIGDSHNWETLIRRPSDFWRTSLTNSMSIQPMLPAGTEDLVKFLRDLSPSVLKQPWFLEFWQDYFKCTLDGHTGGKRYARFCEGIETFPQDQIGRLTKESYLMSAVELILFTLDGIQKKLCPNTKAVCDDFYDYYKEELRRVLRDVPRNSMFQIYRYQNSKTSSNRRMASNYIQIGNWSKADGLSFEKQRRFRTIESKCQPPGCVCRPTYRSFDDAGIPYISQDFRPLSSIDKFANFIALKSDDPHNTDTAWSSPGVFTQPLWEHQPWRFVFLSVSLVLIVTTLSLFSIIVYKISNGSIRGSQAFGLCLLISILVIYVSSVLFLFDPSWNLCRARRFLPSIALAAASAVLIVKGVQLRNSYTLATNGNNSSGTGGYVATSNYWLLWTFIVGVQVAMNIQWSILVNPVVRKVATSMDLEDERTVFLRCNWTKYEFITSQAYVFVLQLLSLSIAIISRSVKRNFQEARWLTLTCGSCAMTWLAWAIAVGATGLPDPDRSTASAFAENQRFADTSTILHLLLSATLMLGFMYGPKMYIIMMFETKKKQNGTSTAGGNNNSHPGYGTVNRNGASGPNLAVPNRAQPYEGFPLPALSHHIQLPLPQLPLVTSPPTELGHYGTMAAVHAANHYGTYVAASEYGYAYAVPYGASVAGGAAPKRRPRRRIPGASSRRPSKFASHIDDPIYGDADEDGKAKRNSCYGNEEDEYDYFDEKSNRLESSSDPGRRDRLDSSPRKKNRRTGTKKSAERTADDNRSIASSIAGGKAGSVISAKIEKAASRMVKRMNHNQQGYVKPADKEETT